VIPGLDYAHHVGLTVGDLDAATELYAEIFGGRILCKMGPLGAEDLPVMPDGRDWTETHIDVAGASLSLSLVEVTPNLLLELFQYHAPEDRVQIPARNCDISGHHLAFHVQDVEAARSYLQGKGFAVMPAFTMEEGPFAGMIFCYTRDPWGNYIEILNRGENSTAPRLLSE
jgi:glyoxylase I family protein